MSAARRVRRAAQRSLAVLALVLAAGRPASAAEIFEFGAPTSTLFDTSIRSAAMGGASAAVFWGEPGVWANAGTLAGVNGVGWVAGRTQVLPDVLDNAFFNSQRLLIGGGGVGFSLMGKPISWLGKAEYELPLVLSGQFGIESTTFRDRTEGWGVGVSPLKLIETLSRLAKGTQHALTTYGDITVGYQAKGSTREVFDVSSNEADTHDWGVGGRLALARWWGADTPFRLDLSGAYSQQNVSEAGTFRSDRTGFALHLSPAPPSERAASPPSLPWWRPGDVPELSIGLAYDHDELHFETPGPTSGSDHYGFEANVFRLLALRVGYLSESDGQIEGWSYGGGLTLPIGPWGSVGYQLASVPTLEGLDRQFRQGWSVWIQPAHIWNDMR